MKKYYIVLMILATIVLVVGIFISKLSSQKSLVVTPGTNDTQQVVKLVDGRQCYTYSHEGTESEPYTTSEFIDITIAGAVVTGTKTGAQAGPDMTNGYTGTIAGTLDGDVIKSIYSYVIEGSAQKEQEIYHAGLTGLDKWRYVLREEGGVLVPDTTTDPKILHYARVSCEPSN